MLDDKQFKISYQCASLGSLSLKFCALYRVRNHFRYKTLEAGGESVSLANWVLEVRLKMSACSGCNIVFKNDVIAVCALCTAMFHANSKGPNCSGCTASETKVLELKGKPRMVYYCAACTANGGQDSSLKTAVMDLQQAIKELSSLKNDLIVLKASVPELRGDINNLRESSEQYRKDIQEVQTELIEMSKETKAKFSSLEKNIKGISTVAGVDKSDSNNIQQTINEIENRKSRQNNLLVYNIPEPEGGDQNKDVDAVALALSKVQNLQSRITTDNVKRLGVFDINKCRPILVKMDCHLDVTAVLVNWKVIPAGINVSADLTECQRSLYKQLKESAKDYNDGHGVDGSRQIVRMFNGNPKLITIGDKKFGDSISKKGVSQRNRKN